VGDEVIKVKVARDYGAGMEPGEQIRLTWNEGAAKVLPPMNSGGHSGGRA
jgi:hypothetical protein